LKTQNFPEEFKNHIEALLNIESPLFFNALAENPPVSIRQNRFKPPTHFHNTQRVEWCQTGQYLAERPLFTADPHFHAGSYYVQEAASMFIEAFVKENFDKNDTITALDLCAAPGGKSTHLISLFNSSSTFFCNELVPKRNAILCENISKWGTANVLITQNEAKDFAPLQNYFDLIVVDAPCSGEGMFRKDPRAIEEWSTKNVEICSARQSEILANIIGSLKENGILIYSTCTFQTCENEDKVQWLCEKMGFEEIKIHNQLSSAIQASNFGYRFYPHRTKSEGFFIACLRKKSHQATAQFQPKTIKKQVQKTALSQVPSALLNMVSSADSFEWFMFKNQYCFAEKNTFAKLQTAEKFSNIKQAGTCVGEEKGKDILPHHAAALSIYLNKHLPSFPLEKDEALRFLKGESLQRATDKGWLAIKYENNCIGWAKSTGDRLNNHYPKEWKIRMDLNSIIE
jgi:16S rRNA C967 or C1407 C5-methylase (RsmB/RsmF family)/NOL1/NOP2/fmu family ribosome biogenesis protein